MTMDSGLLMDMYRKMVTIRTFDARAVEEFHEGNIPGVVHAYIGEEAVAVGVCSALRTTAASPAPTAATAIPSPRALTST